MEDSLDKDKASKRGAKATYNSANALVKPSQVALFEAKCKAQFQKLGIEPTIPAKPLPLFGTRPMDEKSTKNNYLGKCRAFLSFLLDSGKYDDSLLVFHPHCPKGVIAVEAEAVVKFLHIVYTEEGKIARDQEGNTFRNAKGEVIYGSKKYCDWHCPDNMDQFCSALRHIHENGHGMSDTYTDECKNCAEIYKEKGHGGCKSHPIPRYTRLG